MTFHEKELPFADSYKFHRILLHYDKPNRTMTHVMLSELPRAKASWISCLDAISASWLCCTNATASCKAKKGNETQTMQFDLSFVCVNPTPFRQIATRRENELKKPKVLLKTFESKYYFNTVMHTITNLTKWSPIRAFRFKKFFKMFHNLIKYLLKLEIVDDSAF